MSRTSGFIWLIGGGLIGVAGLMLGAIVALRSAPPAPERVRLDDPERLIDTAWGFIEANRPDRLVELIHADSAEMESVLARLGRLLMALQDLATAAQDRFPDEVRTLQAEAASRGGSLLSAARQSRRDEPDEQFLARVLADPYGWIGQSRDRVSVVYVADDVRAILVDGAPAFGVGLTIRQTNTGWRLVLPTTFPIVRKYMPRSREEWQIVASMVTVIENAIRDLAADVRAGRARHLNDAARMAGEKAWIPLVMTIVAYQRALEMREAAPAAAS